MVRTGDDGNLQGSLGGDGGRGRVERLSKRVIKGQTL